MPIEIAVAILLLVNRWSRIAWGLAVGLFAIFAVFSATGIAEGKETCGCFGTHSPSPTTALVLDLFVIFALAMLSPIASAGQRRWFQPSRRMVLVGGVGAFLLGWKGAAYQMPRPLEVDGQYLDIGVQWEQEDFKWVLPVRNTLDEPVEVTRISSSCTCTSIEPESFTVPPGGSVPLQLSLNLTDQERPQVSGDVRPIGFSLRPLLPGGSRLPIEWNVTGAIRKLFDGLPVSIEFPKGSVVLGRIPTPKAIKLESAVPLERLAAGCDPPLCDVDVIGSSTNSREWTLVLTPLVDGTTGFLTSKLIVRAYIQGENKPARISTGVTMWITSDVDVIPDGLAYGAIPAGAEKTETIHFVSASSAKYNISEISIVGVPGQIEEVIPNQTYRCTVTADREGNQLGKLRIAVDSPKGGHAFELIKRISYYGVPLPEPQGTENE